MELVSPPLAAPADSLIQPLDEANRRLVGHVHPPDWQNPEGRGTYDLVVLGAGSAGLVSAVGAAGVGARVAIVEGALLGGDCLNAGCVPSKALLRSARVVGELRGARTFGIDAAPARVDFAAVMRRMRERRATISPHDSAARLTRLGVDVFFGHAAFTDSRTVSVAGRRTLRFNRAVIATGGRPTAPPVTGLAEIPYLTNETLFWLTELPRRLLVIGAGPIGCEMAQAFARFGSQVTVFDLARQVLPREDSDAAALVEGALGRDGVRLELGVTLRKVRRQHEETTIVFSRDGNGDFVQEITGDAVLVAAGRAPNIETLNLPAAGIAFTKAGVTVNDRLQTSNRRVFAAGDVSSAYKFTHAADALARIVIQNALFFGRKKASSLVIPWCTYTTPELAHVGLSERQAAEQGRRVQTITVGLSELDRAIVDDETEGFIRIHHENGRVLGGTIVGGHAGDLIGQVSYAMTTGGSLGDLARTIYPYPTRAEAFRKAGDAYRRTSLTPTLRRWFERYFRWTR
jgi:pyruvate/2-oxoglutarate dehydrogenase complex dihydrolipoamide dehydrogenase (E3) component